MTIPPSEAYPVTYDVEEHLTGRNRLTTAFRIILALPHLLIVGGPAGLSFPAVSFSLGEGDDWDFGGFGSGGLLGIAIFFVSIIAWFAIMITGRHPRGLWDFAVMYVSWRARSNAYIALLRDEYPPFGNGAYPVTFDPGPYPEQRNRLTVFLRIFLIIPHAIVLFFLGLAWAVTAIVGWFAILFTGSYPEGLYRFGVGFLRWSLRVEAYGLLLQDRYPPFSVD